MRYHSSACVHRGRRTRVDGHVRAKLARSGRRRKPLRCKPVQESPSAIKLVTRTRIIPRRMNHNLPSHLKQQVLPICTWHRLVAHSLHTHWQMHSRRVMWLALCDYGSVRRLRPHWRRLRHRLPARACLPYPPHLRLPHPCSRIHMTKKCWLPPPPPPRRALKDPRLVSDLASRCECSTDR